MSYGRRSVWLPVIGILSVSGVLGVVVWELAPPAVRENAVAELDSGAEERYHWRQIVKNPDDLEQWIQFTSAHAEAVDEQEATITNEQVAQMLGRIHDLRVEALADFWYRSQVIDGSIDVAPVTAIADDPHPPRLANYIVGRIAFRDQDWNGAASRFEREGFLFAKDRRLYLRRALRTWANHDLWSEVRKRAGDPRYAPVFDAGTRLDLAAHEHDVAGILRWLLPANYEDTHVLPVLMALLAAGLWFAIAARLGRIGDDDVKGRALLYGVSFVLGVLSIYPTILIGCLEEVLLGLKETGTPGGDAFFFIVGVGFREELCKLLLFLPLMPALMRRGSRIEAMTCGALVGLGFAAEENVNYFHEAISSALPRFMTANFLHMSLTALVALAVYDTSRGRQTSHDQIGVVFPVAVLVHGLYDFLLGESGLGIVAMALFILMARQFLRQLVMASSREEERDVLRLLIISMALITGASYVYGSAIVGPLFAVATIALGGVGVLIVIYMFVQELG